jgi:hypothetical protein
LGIGLEAIHVAFWQRILSMSQDFMGGQRDRLINLIEISG